MKERIVRSVTELAHSQAETARRLLLAESTVSRVMREYRRSGTVSPPKRKPGPARKLKKKHLLWLKRKVKKSPFMSTYELSHEFNLAFPSKAVHRSTILRALHALGLSFKKNSFWRTSLHSENKAPKKRLSS